MLKTDIMKFIAAIYRKVTKQNHPRWGWPEDELKERQISNDYIYELLLSDSPCFIGRMGTIEGQIVWNYLSVHSSKSYMERLWSFLNGKSRLPWWDEGRPFYELQNNAGFFSDNFGINEVEKFCKLYLKYIPQMDVCGSFEYYERFLPFKKECKNFQLETLYPFLVERSWMRALKGKKVLVIHPFKDSIEKQYLKREKLFKNGDWLPEFSSLIVIKAIQSAAGEGSCFKNWFEALDFMKSEIDKVDFDVAIIGCGAYGLPLAGYCKEIGKKAIHLGGGVQLLFGIKGKRWEEQYTESCYRDLFNEYWCYPSDGERPKNATKVEGGCYW